MHKLVYRSRVRFVWLLFYLAIPTTAIATSPKPDAGLMLALCIPLGIFFLPLVWTFRTKVELSPAGVTVSEGVFTLFAPWQDIRALDLTPGREGAILDKPLPEKQARRIRFWAAANHRVPSGALQGGALRHRLIGDGLFMPLQAFRRIVASPEFQRAVHDRAPHVEMLSGTALAAEEERADQSRNIWTFTD